MIGYVLEWITALLISLFGPLLTVNSLEQLDPYPLYTMQYYGDFGHNMALLEAWDRAGAQSIVLPELTPAPAARPARACSLFAALADPANALYGRNFDWDYSPALLLFSDPPDGYASVSMVDIAYLGFQGEQARQVHDLPPEERSSLIAAPNLPFDGMNERGLAIGMAAVPASSLPDNPTLPTTGSLGIIREVLDHAANVDEALALFEQYNINMEGGPPLHYLVADASGQSALVEFYHGERVVNRNQQPWDMATNFIRASALDNPESMCSRYARISQTLTAHEGKLTPADAFTLLEAVSQNITQWSIVYGMSTGEISVVMARQYDTVYTVHLPLTVGE